MSETSFRLAYHLLKIITLYEPDPVEWIDFVERRS